MLVSSNTGRWKYFTYVLQEIGALQALSLRSYSAFLSPSFIKFSKTQALDPTVIILIPILVVPG